MRDPAGIGAEQMSEQARVLDEWRRQARERRIASSYARAYARAPLTDEETQLLDAAAVLAADLPQ